MVRENTHQMRNTQLKKKDEKIKEKKRTEQYKLKEKRIKNAMQNHHSEKKNDIGSEPKPLVFPFVCIYPTVTQALLQPERPQKVCVVRS